MIVKKRVINLHRITFICDFREKNQLSEVLFFYLEIPQKMNKMGKKQPIARKRHFISGKAFPEIC